MIMLIHPPVKSFLGSTHFQFENQADGGHDFEVAIDSSQADPGQSTPYKVIDLIGGRMRGDLLEFFQDHPPLSRQPKWLLCRKNVSTSQ